MKAYQTLIASVGLAVVVSTAAMAQLLVADKLQPIDPILDVQPLELRDDFVLCGGSNGSGPSAYYNKGTDLSGRLGNVVGKDVVQMEGGTITCANALAEGRADAAIMQDDLVPWLKQTDSPLLNSLGYGGKVMTEAMMAFCSRNGPSGNEEDFGNIAQKKKYVIAIAGTAGAGVNLSLTAIAGHDSGWKKSQVVYAGSWENGFNAVIDGKAACVVGISNPNGDQWEMLDDQFGSEVRMMEVKDSDFWDIEDMTGQQLYGELTIDKKHPALDDFLDWKGKKGKGTWSPEMPAFTASVYYRSESVPADKQSGFTKAVKSQADLIELER